MGYEGVDKRIDVLASAIRFGRTVYDLEELELAYAPPIRRQRTRKHGGYVAANCLKGDMKSFTGTRWTNWTGIRFSYWM